MNEWNDLTRQRTNTKPHACLFVSLRVSSCLFVSLRVSVSVSLRTHGELHRIHRTHMACMCVCVYVCIFVICVIAQRWYVRRQSLHRTPRRRHDDATTLRRPSRRVGPAHVLTMLGTVRWARSIRTSAISRRVGASYYPARGRRRWQGSSTRHHHVDVFVA